VQRVHRPDGEATLELLWSREMDTGVYRPCWLHCQTPGGPVRALSFTLSRRSPSHAGELSEAQLLDILRHAHGRYGRTLDYLLHTAQALQALGIRDSHVQRLVTLVQRHRLLEGELPRSLTRVWQPQLPQLPLTSSD
jgi:cation transport protein ChaC